MNVHTEFRRDGDRKKNVNMHTITDFLLGASLQLDLLPYVCSYAEAVNIGHPEIMSDY